MLSNQLFSLSNQTTYPLVASLGNPTKAELGCCESQNVFNIRGYSTPNSTANGVARIQMYVTLANTLLLAQVWKSCITLRGDSLKKVEQVCVREESDQGLRSAKFLFFVLEIYLIMQTW